MSTVAGIDYSTRFIDVVLLDENTDAATWHRFELEGNDAFDRARDVRRVMYMPGSEFWDDVIAIGIEQPRGNFGVTHMMRIQGAILACLPTSLLVHPLNPSDWRKTVGLAGNASKKDVQVWAAARLYKTGWSYFRQPAPQQDFFDAYCIALATRTVLQRTEAA